MQTGYLYAIGAAILWGLIYAIDQKILANISPLAFLFISSLIAAIIIFPIILLDSVSFKGIFSMSNTNIMLMVIAVILAIFANYWIFAGIKLLGAPTASIIEIAYPFFVVLFSFIIFHSSPNIFFFIGGTLVFIGSAIIIKFS